MPSKLNTAHQRGGSPEAPAQPAPTERAHRACEKCTRTKKKCDKALPSCSRCSRLAATCCYDFVYTGPAVSFVDSSVMGGSFGGDQNARAASARGVFDLFNLDVQADAIMTLLSSRNVDWRESAERFFRCIYPWLSIIPPGQFAARLEGSVPQKPELALLLVCMHLAGEPPGSGSPSEAAAGSEAMFTDPTYVGARRMLGFLRASCEPCLQLVQCGILLGLYEFGHGEYTRAYATIGDANIMAQVLKLGPGSYTNDADASSVTPDEEERRNVYWGLFVLDRLIHVECRLMWMPLHVPSPTSNDLLPTTSLAWEGGRASRTTNNNPHSAAAQHPRVSTRPSVPLGVFQRFAQSAVLLDKALEWDKGACAPGTLPGMTSFTGLDVEARALIEAMVCQSSRVGEYYACFATCTCLLLLVYCRFLCTIDPASIHCQTADVEVLKAIAGINFTVRMIADTTIDLNSRLARRPDLLAASSPVTTYSAYHSLRVLTNFEHIITGANVHFPEFYSSLHFFGKRWAAAAPLVDRLETFIHDKDKEPEQFLDPSSNEESDPGTIPLE